MFDSEMVLATPTTATGNFTVSPSSANQYAFLTTPGVPRRGMYAEVFVTGQTATTVGPTVYFQLVHSADTTNWYNLQASIPFTLNATVQNPQPIFLGIPGDSYANVGLNVVFSATTGGPSVTYNAYITDAYAA